MPRRAVRAAAGPLLACLVLSGPATAEDDCPFGVTEHEAIEKALGAASSCAAAVKIFRACALGASGDVARGALVQQRCERDFLARLSAPERQSYKAAVAACWRKYGRREGTMYLAMAADCAVAVSQRYSARKVGR